MQESLGVQGGSGFCITSNTTTSPFFIVSSPYYSIYSYIVHVHNHHPCIKLCVGGSLILNLSQSPHCPVWNLRNVLCNLCTLRWSLFTEQAAGGAKQVHFTHHTLSSKAPPTEMHFASKCLKLAPNAFPSSPLFLIGSKVFTLHSEWRAMCSLRCALCWLMSEWVTWGLSEQAAFCGWLKI